GRTTELETLARFVREAHDGDLALIQIEGEAGVARSEWRDELVGELEDVRVGRASCSELERHLPYVPLATALRDALADVDLDARRMPALAQLMPELALDAPGPEFEEVEVLEALVALVAENGPMVLLIDDLQWADSRTLAALGDLQRRGAGLDAALVTTVRGTRGSSDGPLQRLAPDKL